MNRDVSFIKNADTLIEQYGAWPSFHDAMVEEVHLWRGHITDGDWDDRNVMPVLTMVIRILGAAQDGGTFGTKDVVATLRFRHLRSFRLEDFNNVNDILDLSIEVLPRKNQQGADILPYLNVRFEPGFGIKTSFDCFGIEVMEARSIASSAALLRPRLTTA